ncbi:MAG: helix-turn-helix transcriptional regulator [Hyphomicrobiales bacterium]|nr:helix-turn-helix transcriptional regulator [Hyphomicrobiales bacterium]
MSDSEDHATAAAPSEDPPPTAAEPTDASVRAARASTREDADEAFLVELGQRVRRMRALRGMSRKVLAQVSGISERYIAQLEGGQGNVSIMLLRRVAEATGAPLEDLVGAVDDPDWRLVRDLLRGAPPATIAEVKALLSGEKLPGAPRAVGEPHIAVDRVALIGLRGAGKSTLGRMVAERLGWPFVELNREIETEHGFSITEILNLYGQDGYRRLERSTLQRLVDQPGPMLLATGGGIVGEPVTFELLLASYFTIWVKTSPAEHMSRVRQQGDLRPMANDKAAMAELITILSSREPLYARARAQLDTSGMAVEASAARLFGLVQSYCAVGCPWQSRNRGGKA